MQESPIYPDARNPIDLDEYDHGACPSGVMWSAIFSGAITIIIISLMLFTLASAFGFAALSPWGNNTPSLNKAFAISGVIGLILIQWLSAVLGGYLTGRLRSKYVSAHTHEIFFRDTVHGFLAWSLATLIGVFILTSASLHMHRLQGEFGKSDNMRGPAAHYVNRLFSPQSSVTLSEQDRLEALSALETEAMDGTLSQDDKNYLTQLVAARTGLSNADAESRVEDVLDQEKNGMAKFHKYAAETSLFLFFSMLIGAFIASVAAGLGGQHRDIHYSTGSFVEE